jgi:hypothetical protein
MQVGLASSQLVPDTAKLAGNSSFNANGAEPRANVRHLQPVE